MGVHLGGASAWKVETGKGGLVRSFQWLDGQPTLFVYPHQAQAVGALAIPLDSAYLWAEPNGYPNLDHAIKTAAKVAPVLGLLPNRGTLHAIIDTVLEGIPTLIEMPPFALAGMGREPEAVGELKLKVGESVIERLITEDDVGGHA